MAVWHMQGEPKKVWVVRHNLGRIPLVQVMNDENEVVMTAVTRLNASTATVEFNEPTTGSMLLV